MTPAFSIPVDVVGAGLAGLATATGLARLGAGVTVLERAPALTEAGAGVQISPNGAAALRALGLWDRVAAAGDATDAVVLCDGASGRVLVRTPLQGRAFRLLHRADLLAALADGAVAAGVTVQTGQAVRTVADGLHLSGGGTRHPGLIVGADGLRSVVHHHLNGTVAPFFTRQVAWRAIIPGDGGPAAAQVFMAPGRHLVTYPLRGGRLRNIVAVEERSDWAEEGWSHADSPDTLRAAFAGFGGPVPDWLAAVRDCWLWGLFRHPVARVWQEVREDGAGVALVGDAAHPTLPFLAQGANLAFEDAATLTACLGRHPVLQALAAYQAARAPRATRVVAAATANARIYHAGGLRRHMLHTALRLAGLALPDLPVRRFAWVYDHDAAAI
jgi:salicylate hydroxylase